MVTNPPKEQQPSSSRFPLVPLICLALGCFCVWYVVRLSPQKGSVDEALSRFQLPDSLRFFDGRGLEVAVVVVIVVVLWLMFRRPRAR